MFRYDAWVGSSILLFAGSLGCQPQKVDTHRDLSELFPDAARALGTFSINLEKSRDINALSEARISIHQDSIRKHVTLQIKMVHSQEHTTLSFLHQNKSFTKTEGQPGLTQDQASRDRQSTKWTARSGQQDSGDNPEGSLDVSTSGASRCLPSTGWPNESLASPSESRTPSLTDASPRFRIPMPLSIRSATALEVSGLGDNWKMIDGALVWHKNTEMDERIELRWKQNSVPELRYPLQTQTMPQNLKAQRVDGSHAEAIAVEWIDGFVWLQAKDVKPGAWLELQYEVPGTDAEFTLPQSPISDDMKTLVLAQDCTRQQFLLENNDLTWSCSFQKGTLWAASYRYHQSSGAIDFTDWPQLASQKPQAVTAFWDAGEQLEVETQGQAHVLRQLPAEASRICLRATWTSNSAH